MKVKVNGSELSGAINTLFVAAGLSSTLYDVTTLTVGYMFIVFLVLIYLGITALIRYFKDEPLTLGGICRIVETVSPLLSQFLVVMRLASFVVVMFGVFPLMCGWLLDVCTVTMFGQTMSYRLQFLSVSPLASSLVHWVVGAVYDWYSLIFENLLREVPCSPLLIILFFFSLCYYLIIVPHFCANCRLFALKFCISFMVRKMMRRRQSVIWFMIQYTRLLGMVSYLVHSTGVGLSCWCFYQLNLRYGWLLQSSLSTYRKKHCLTFCCFSEILCLCLS